MVSQKYNAQEADGIKIDDVEAFPKLIEELQEVRGVLNGLERASKTLLKVQLNKRLYLVPDYLNAQLETLRGQRTAITRILGKHYVRKMKGTTGL